MGIILKRARNRRYASSEKGRKRNRVAVNRYAATAKGRRVRKRYANSRAGKLSNHRADQKYDTSTKGQINQRLWNKGLSEKEKERARLAWGVFDGRCDCCGTKKHGGKGWHLDHKGNKFRGILCHGCNIGAGNLKDSPERCFLLAIYLKRTK